MYGSLIQEELEVVENVQGQNKRYSSLGQCLSRYSTKIFLHEELRFIDSAFGAIFDGCMKG